MAEIVQDENPRRNLYRLLLADKTPGVGDRVKKYSFTEFENRLLTDENTQNKMGWYLESKGLVADPVDFSERYLKTIAAPTPKQKPAPVAPVPVEQVAPPIGIAAPASIKGAAPSVTDIGREMAFEPAVQQPIEPIEPVGVMAPEPAQKPMPSVTEVAREMAFKPPVEPKMPKEKKERGFGEWIGDVAGTISAGGERIAENILGGIGYYAQAQAATDPMVDLPYEKRQQMMQEAGQTMYDVAEAAQKDFQNELAKRNIETSVLQAIDKKQYKNIPEAVLYTVGDAAMQIIPSVLTMGGSTFLQTLPMAYRDGVEAIAKEKGISPEQVIASGEDAFLTATISSGIQSALERVGAGQVSKAIASKGAYKAIRDWLLKQNVNKNLARAASILGVGIGEGATEYLQEATGQAGVTAAKSPTARAFFEKIPNELFTAQAERQRQEAFVGGLIGGGGLAGAGRAISKFFERPIVEAPVVTPVEAEAAPAAPSAPAAPAAPPISREEMDANIEAGQKRAGFVFQSPLASLNQEGKSIISNVQRNKYIATAPVKELFQELYDAYKIYANQRQATSRNLTTNQIEAGIADFENALQVLGDYISKRDSGKFVREYVNRAAQEVAPVEEATPVAEEAPLEELPPVTEEVPAEEVVPATGMFEGLQGPTEEQAAPETGMFEGIAGPQAEEEVVSAAPVEEVAPEAPAALPKELLGEIIISSTGFGGDREHTTGKVKLQELKVLDVGIETARKTLKTDKSFKPSKEPIVVGVDVNTGEKQLLDGYHRYLIKNGKGEVAAKFIPMRNGEIISFEEAKAPVAPAPKGRKKKEAPVTPAPAAPKKEGAKESLGKRLKGDALLNAEDTLAELSDNGATINPDGTVVVYHRTTKDKADAIVKNNEMFGLEDGVFFSTSEKGQAEGYGDVVVKMNVPIEKIQIDDTFGNEAHVRIPTKKANQKISVSKFAPQIAKAETKVAETKEGKKAEAKEEKVTPAPAAPETKTEVEYTQEEDDNLKAIQTEANLNYGNYIKNIPSGRKDKFANDIYKYEATNPFTGEKVIFNKKSDAADYVIKEISAGTTKKGREGIFRRIQELNRPEPAPAPETKFKPNPKSAYYISKGADEVYYTLREIGGDDLDVHVMNLSKDLNESKRKAKELIGEDVEFDETSLGRDYNKITASKTGKGQQLAKRLEGEGVAATLSFGKHYGKTIDEIFEIDPSYILYLNREYPTNTVFQKGVRDNPKIKEFIEQSLADKEQQRKNLESLTEIGGVKFDDKGVAKAVSIKGKIKYINNRMGPQGMYKVYILDTEYGVPVEVSGDIGKYADGKLEQGTELSFTANVQKVGDKFKVIGRKSEYTKPAETKEGKKAEAKEDVYIENIPNIIYRGGEPFDAKKVKSDGVSFSKNKEIGIYWAGSRKSGKLQSFTISPSANILTDIPSNLIPKERATDQDKIRIVNYAKVKGFDGVDLSGIFKEDEIRIFNPNVIIEITPQSISEAAPSFTSEQSSEAATAFDKAKTSKGFDKKYGKGAYKALSDITKNFDAIMDKVSDKIKQDCL